MSVTLPVSRSLRPFLLFLQSMLLIGVVSVAANPARAADDCSSFWPYACLRESFSTGASERTLSVNVLRQPRKRTTDYFNVIIPGHGQGRVEPGGTFTLTVPDDGRAVYSIEGCSNLFVGMSSTCGPWTQIVRQFAPVQASAAQAQPCASGYVWRDNFDGDTLCVKPELRHKLADGTYRAGYVWRDSFIGDAVCVTPAERDAAPPPVPEKPIKSTSKGGSGGAPIPGGVLSCQGGGGMKMTISSQTAVFIAFTPAAQPSNAASPGPGECAWPDRLFAAGEAHRFALDPGKPNAQLLMDAIRTGGTFQLTAHPVGTFIMVSAIDNVQVVDSTPLSPGPVGGGEAGDTPQTPADMGGMPMQPAGGSCGSPGAVAMVVINQPGLDKLNVRTGPGGQVIGTVPEGGMVSVAGPCGAVSGAAGLIKQKSPQGGGASGWCQISAPVSGCVSAQFLQFGGTDTGTNLPNGAAGLVKSTGKQPTLALATAGFGGTWSANADTVAYSLSLRQKGSGVSGNYRGADGSAGQINGQVSGNVLRFAWVQNDGTKGSGKFVLSGDGQSFEGSYSFGNNPDAVEGSWNGTRQ